MKAINLLYTLAASALLSSCFTEGYDLSDVSGEVGTDVDITLPSSSSGPVELRNLLKLEDDGLLKIVTGPDGEEIYAVSEKDTHEASIDLGVMRVKRPQISDYTSSLDLKLGHGQTVTSTVKPDFLYHYTIDEGKATQLWNREDSPRISDDVVRIDCVGFYDRELIMLAQIVGLEDFSPYAHLDDVVLSVPRDIHFKRATINGHEAKSIAPGKITLTDKVDPRRFPLNQLAVVLVLDTMHTGHDLVLDAIHHNLKFAGSMQLTGKLRITGAEILEYHPDYATTPATMPQKITISGHSEFYDDLVVHTFSGRVRRTVEPKEIEIKNLPEILQRDDVVADLTEPMIFATVKTSLDASADVRASVSSASLLPEKCSTPRLHIEGNGKENKFYLGCTSAPKYFPKDTPEKHYSEFQYKEVSNLRKLLQNILADKKVTIEVEPVEAECRNIEVLGEHKIEATQEVLVPLTFGEKFRLSYEGTKMGIGLGSSLSELVLSDDALIEISGEVNSTLPFEALLTLDLLNAAGEELSEVVEFANLDEKEGSESYHGVKVAAGAKEQPFHFLLKARKGHNLMEIINPGPTQLEGIHYKATAQKGQEGEALHPHTSLSIDKVLIHIKAKADIAL